MAAVKQERRVLEQEKVVSTYEGLSLSTKRRGGKSGQEFR